MRAGVFDSGVGGLTVVKSLQAHHLFSEIIYFGDTARVPYGVKDKNTIIRYSLEALEFFKNFNIDIMITACNSVSAYAIDELRQNAPFEVSGVIEPGVLALKNRAPVKEASILILGTRATINSGKYERLLREHGFNNITSLAPSLFVPIVEEGLFEGKVLETAMQHYFSDLTPPDYIILGCTHFPLIAGAIGNYFPNAILIHSGDAIVEFLEREHRLVERFEKTELKLFASENPEHLKQTAALWLGNDMATDSRLL
jgi:glutamate racemase